MSQPPEQAPSPSKRGPLRDFLRKIGPAGPIAAFATFMPFIGTFVAIAIAPRLSAWMAAHGVVVMIAFASGFGVLVAYALVPTYANSLLAGWTFKFPAGFPTVMCGLTWAATISYFVAHRIIGHRV